MTDTPHLHALAMRTAADKYSIYLDAFAPPADLSSMAAQLECSLVCKSASKLLGEFAILPLEADHAALLAEAVKLPEVAALIEAASEQAGYMSLLGDDGDLLRNLVNALQPFLALETT